MTTKKVVFVEDEIYHICSRGVDKRTIFIDDKDRFRFIHDLYEFNNEELATNLYYKQPYLQSYEIRSHKIGNNKVRCFEAPDYSKFESRLILFGFNL